MDHALFHAPTPAWPSIRRGRIAAEPILREVIAGLVIGGLLALGFAPQALPAGGAGAAWRLSCLGYAWVCLARGVDRRQAAALGRVFVPFLLGVAIDAMVRPGVAALADFARQLFIVGFAGIVFGAAHDPVARRIGLWALFAAGAAILTDALVRTLPTLAGGWTYAAARTLKFKSFQNGYNANEVCFAGLVALLTGYCDRLVPRWLLMAMMALIGLCAAVLTARAPLAALVAGVAGGWVFSRAAVAAACARQRWLGAIGTAALIAGILLLFLGHIDAIAHSAQAALLAGRAALWQIAIAAWPQHPLFGFGPGCFQPVIRANLGKAFLATRDQYTELYQLQAGGFHNVWLSVLVERGAVGLSGLFVSWCLLAGLAARYLGGLSPPQRWLVATLLVTLFLRGQVELAGLFDDADDPIDQIVMMAIGLTFPRLPRTGLFRGRSLAVQAAAAARAARL